MIFLFRLYFPLVLRQWFAYIVGSIIVIFILSQFFSSYAPFLLLSGTFGFWLAAGQRNKLLGKNLNWIITFPISKKKIFLFSYIWGALTWLVFFISVSSVILSVLLIKGDLSSVYGPKGQRFWAEVFGVFSKWWLKHPPSNWIEETQVEFATVAIIIFNGFHAFCASLIDPAAIQKRFKLNSNISFKESLRRGDRKIISVIFICLFSFLYFHSYFTYGFGQAILWCFILNVLPVLSTSTSLSLSKRHTKIFTWTSITFAFLQTLSLYYLAHTGAHNPSSERRAASILFVGPLGQNISRGAIAQLMESGLNESDFNSLAQFYLEHFHKDHPVKKSEDAFLRLGELLKVQKSEAGVGKVISLFDPSEFNSTDLKQIFEKFAQVSSASISFPILISLLRAKVSVPELIEFLQSKNPSGIQYALIKSRYNRELKLIPIIEQNLKTYRDDARLMALKTLSILYGRYVGLDDWVKYSNGVASKSSGTTSELTRFKPDCTPFKGPKIPKLTPDQILALNICIRQEVPLNHTKTIEAIERQHWFEVPLTGDQNRVIQQVFVETLLE